MTLLIGRGLCGPLAPIEITPGAASLTLTTHAPTASVLERLFLNHFEGTVSAEGPFVDEISGITWEATADDNPIVFSGTAKFNNTGIIMPAPAGSRQTIWCGQFQNLEAKSWTVEGWVQLGGGYPNSVVRFGVGKVSATTPNFNMDLVTTSDLTGCKITFGSNVGGAIRDSSTFNLATSTWYHWAFQYDQPNDNWECYFNGTRYIQENGVGDITNPDNDFCIQHTIVDDPVYIDEVRGVIGLQYSGATYTPPSTSF